MPKAVPVPEALNFRLIEYRLDGVFYERLDRDEKRGKRLKAGPSIRKQHSIFHLATSIPVNGSYYRLATTVDITEKAVPTDFRALGRSSTVSS